MSLCPLCNGLTTPQLICPSCNEPMEDDGLLEGYYEPYSPYLPYEVLDQVDGVDSEKVCLHLCHCPHCGYQQRYHCALLSGPELTE
mgnify:CR=1 FL=1